MDSSTPQQTRISLIAAIGENSEIGKGNQLLWHLPADFKHFKKTTMGKPVIMGRRTFESLPGVLPGRLNIVLSRQALNIKGVTVVNSLSEAIELAQQHHSEIMVIGGEMLYRNAIDLADRLYITHVKHSDEHADAFFPEIVKDTWQLKSSELNHADEKHLYDFSINVYERR